MKLEERLARWLPQGLTLRIQLVLGVVGLVGVFVAPFLPLQVAVIVINIISMVTLTVAALAGVDSARNPPSEENR